MFLTISKFLESYREALASVLPPVKRMAISPTDFVLHRLSLLTRIALCSKKLLKLTKDQNVYFWKKTNLE